MSKELYVSSTPHETKVAIVEEDQLAEIYFERENEYTLAGSIYKGRVTRVLPGMQSAFVDIGLERDAFLYVSDFMELPESDEGDFDTTPADDGGSRRHERAPRQEPETAEASAENGGRPAAEEHTDADGPENGVEGQPAARAESQPGSQGQTEGGRERGGEDRRGRFGRRRRGRRGRGFPESKYDSRDENRYEAQGQRPEAQRQETPRRPGPPSGYQPIILPGESISKYRNMSPVAETAPVRETEGQGGEQNTSPASSFDETERFDPAIAGAHVIETEGAEARVQVAPAPPPKRPTEEIDVPSILQGRAVEVASTPEPAVRRESHAPQPAVGPTGLMEEEEIEGEESEGSAALADFEEEEYDDFEEELLDRVDEMEHREVSSGAAEVTEGLAAETPAGEATASAQEEETGDFEEEEMKGTAAEPGNAEEPVARAEVRGPSGHQHRVAFDRNRRGRRGGRRGRDSAPRGRRFHRGPLPQISDLLKEGQEILVQIAKEPIGKKGARITSHIALPGRYLVYMPTVNHNGVSRKIASEEERQRLKRIISSERQSANGHQGGGFIVRTAAASANEDDLRADIRFLLNLWNEIKGRAEGSKGGTLIYHDLNLVERILRDQVSEGFSHIWVDSEQEYERILRFINRFQPSLVKRVKLYTQETPLFEQFSIQDEINKALKSKVWLKSGGYIVINQTEALVAIDVNTGKYVGRTQKLEDTIVKTNVDAIKEIVRQIRLRDLGGIIVIDFIDMDERRNRHRVMQALEEALRNDRAPSKVLQFNDFGLVAITRKRVKQSLERTLGTPCTYCTGTGLIKSVATVCNEVYVEMRKMANHLERGDVIVRVNPEVGKALKANNARWLQEMEDLTGKTVIVKPDATLHQEQFDIH